MRALRMAFAAAFPFEIRPFNRARSSSLSLTTNFLFATAIPLVGSIRQNKNQYSRWNATSLFKWCIPLALHPFVIGQPFRNKYLAKALEYIASHQGVWLTTSDEIAAHYLADPSLSNSVLRRPSTSRA